MLLAYPEIDPVAISFGPLKVHWYGLMYIVGFVGAWWLGRLRADRPGLKRDDIGDMLFYGALGVVLGGRIGYVLFYGLPRFLDNPLWAFQIWDGGMSFHGGLLGVLLAALLFARKHGLAFFQLTDFIAPLVPIGLGAGRIGNFINHELPGRVTDVPWALVFPGMGGQGRHPSSLYQFFFEGIVLFWALWMASLASRRRGFVSGLFLVCYGAFRFLSEFFRCPDPQLGFIAFGWLTVGQLLSLPMVVAGIALIAWSRHNEIDDARQEKPAR